MKLAYITNARIPSERANAMQTVQMCAAFAGADTQVTLYYPNRRTLRQFKDKDVWTYYNVPHNFDLCPVPCVDWFHRTGGRMVLERLVFFLQTTTFAVSLLNTLRRSGADLYYARDPFVLALLAIAMPSTRKQMLFEMHSFPASNLGRRLHRWMLSRIGGVVTITNGLRERLLALGISDKHILVAPDGVDLGRYQNLTREGSRLRLRLDVNETLAVYTGHLYAWKGADVFARAVARVEGMRGLLVGGTEGDTQRMRRLVADSGWRNVEVVGYVSPDQIPYYQTAADILVLPNSAKAEISSAYTSPLKLFEYMAAERPIVASDLPSLREVLNEENSVLVPADDADVLAAALRRLQADPALSHRLARRARQDVDAYSWAARAARVAEFAGGHD